MSGKDAIIEKIITDARNIANSTLEEANKRGAEILQAANNDVRIYREKNLRESYAERDEIVRRAITGANLEVRKILLFKRQELMAEAFERATKAIKEETGNYKKLVSSMLDLAEDGDIAVFSKEDKAIFDEKYLSEYCKKAKKKIDFGGYGDFVGGVILTGKGSDKNMSLEVELKSLREEREPEIAGILFGEGR